MLLGVMTPEEVQRTRQRECRAILYHLQLKTEQRRLVAQIR